MYTSIHFLYLIKYLSWDFNLYNTETLTSLLMPVGFLSNPGFFGEK